MAAWGFGRYRHGYQVERGTAKIDKILAEAKDAQMEADQLAEEAEHLMMDVDLDEDDSSPHYVENSAL